MESLSKIKDISRRTFYEMEKFSQFVIDVVEEVVESDLTDSTVREALVYDIENVLDIISPERVDDIEVLTDLKKVLNEIV
jgi:hypothetical protein